MCALLLFLHLCACHSQACGIPFETLLAVDKKKGAIDKAKLVSRNKVAHFFKDLDAAVQRCGNCVFHGGTCHVARRSADCSISGLNCQKIIGA